MILINKCFSTWW